MIKLHDLASPSKKTSLSLAINGLMLCKSKEWELKNECPFSSIGQPNRFADGIPGGGKLKPEGPVRIPVQRQPGDAEER